MLLSIFSLEGYNIINPQKNIQLPYIKDTNNNESINN